MQHVLGVDHCPLLVHDLDAAERAMGRLGFRPTPRGVHSAPMGTANVTVPFRDGTYLETVGILRPTPRNADRRARLAARGEGPFGLAFKTDDARAAASAFAAVGLGSGEAVEFARPVELPAGTREARFTVARTWPGSTPGAWIFVCQHHTPDVVWREDHLEHPNGARGILEVVGVTSDPLVLARSWGVIFGARVRADGRSVAIEGSGAAVRFLEPAAFRRRYGPVGATAPATGEPDLAALRLAVRDVEEAAEVLRRHEVPFHRLAGGTIGVAAEHACGAVLEFAARTTA